MGTSLRKRDNISYGQLIINDITKTVLTKWWIYVGQGYKFNGYDFMSSFVFWSLLREYAAGNSIWSGQIENGIILIVLKKRA